MIPTWLIVTVLIGLPVAYIAGVVTGYILRHREANQTLR